MKALEMDENHACAWNHLGVVGGGTVRGKRYGSKDGVSGQSEAFPLLGTVSTVPKF